MVLQYCCLSALVADRRPSAGSLVQGEFTDLLHKPWSQLTLDELRYRVVKPEYQARLKLAEGSTSEVLRTASLNHVNFGAHTDWIRDLMLA